MANGDGDGDGDDNTEASAQPIARLASRLYHVQNIGYMPHALSTFHVAAFERLPRVMHT